LRYLFLASTSPQGRPTRHLKNALGGWRMKRDEDY
jgi:hypothetical protein